MHSAVSWMGGRLGEPLALTSEEHRRDHHSSADGEILGFSVVSNSLYHFHMTVRLTGAAHAAPRCSCPFCSTIRIDQSPSDIRLPLVV